MIKDSLKQLQVLYLFYRILYLSSNLLTFASKKQKEKQIKFDKLFRHSISSHHVLLI